MDQKSSSFLLRFLVYSSALISIAVILCIIAYILISGIPSIIEEIIKLLHGKPSLFSLKYTSSNVSLVPATINTLIITVIGIAISTIFGIFTSIYLVEYANKNSYFSHIIKIAMETLAGIPSILYGLFGSLFFVSFLGFGMSMISGALTISLMVLPLIIRATQEALQAVPDSFREASFALGAGKCRTIFTIVLPFATSGILAGMILAMGRIVGETAALLYTSGTSPTMGTDILSTGRTLSIHMYMLTSEGLHVDQAYATAAVLLLLILGMNIASTSIAKRILHGKSNEICP